MLLIVVIVLAASGGKKSASSGSQTVASKTEKAPSKSTSTTGATAPSAAPGATAPAASGDPASPSHKGPSQAIASATGPAVPDETADSAATEPETGSDAPAEPTTSSAATPTTTIESKPAVARPKKFGGKRLVLEYDNQARDTKPATAAAPADQHAVAKARAAYNSGNQRLFAGDTNGAIRFYKESLVHYPGYVAGYRGLGLAYMQARDKVNALRALRTYISSVPNAKDATLIRRRIATLEAR